MFITSNWLSLHVSFSILLHQFQDILCKRAEKVKKDNFVYFVALSITSTHYSEQYLFDIDLCIIIRRTLNVIPLNIILIWLNVQSHKVMWACTCTCLSVFRNVYLNIYLAPSTRSAKIETKKRKTKSKQQNNAPNDLLNSEVDEQRQRQQEKKKRKKNTTTK